MCIPAALTALGVGGGAAAAGATAAGATAAAGTFATTLQTIGALVGIGGSLVAGAQGRQAAREQVAALEVQKAEERALTATRDNRESAKFLSAIRQQRAELAARGVSLDSVTAVALGQTAAQEMSFQSQAIRSEGRATQRELTAAQRNARLTGASAMLRGVVGAADSFLSAAPDLWPGFTRGEGVID